MEAHPAEILDVEQQRTLSIQGATEAAKLARERYGIDLAKVARDPAEALALARAYAADALLDPTSSRLERGGACKLLLESIPVKVREGQIGAEAPKGKVISPKRLFGGSDASESAVG